MYDPIYDDNGVEIKRERITADPMWDSERIFTEMLKENLPTFEDVIQAGIEADIIAFG